MPTKPHGRPRSLDYRKKVQVRDLVAGGARLDEAAVAVGVSVRTIQREARWDAQFDEELRGAQAAPADPHQLMQRAARSHWRAAAWLLEREQPERYGRRRASSCSPKQFDAALRMVIEAALEYVPPQLRSELFEHLDRASTAAFQTVFPQLNQWGGRTEREFPPTPLATLEKALHACHVDKSLRDLSSHVAEPLQGSHPHVAEPLRGSLPPGGMPSAVPSRGHDSPRTSCPRCTEDMPPQSSPAMHETEPSLSKPTPTPAPLPSFLSPKKPSPAKISGDTSQAVAAAQAPTFNNNRVPARKPELEFMDPPKHAKYAKKRRRRRSTRRN